MNHINKKQTFLTTCLKWVWTWTNRSGITQLFSCDQAIRPVLLLGHIFLWWWSDICCCTAFFSVCLYVWKSIAESFYYVKYGLSIITSKIPSKILSNENKKTGVSRKIVCFGILIHVLSWRQQKHQCLCFHYWDFLTNFWHNNWRSIFDVVERLCSSRN